eukprot:310276-Prorocentrum_minimum.AAC.1
MRTRHRRTTAVTLARAARVSAAGPTTSQVHIRRVLISPVKPESLNTTAVPVIMPLGTFEDMSSTSRHNPPARTAPHTRFIMPLGTFKDMSSTPHHNPTSRTAPHKRLFRVYLGFTQ